jgi:hypothetical protein
VQYQVALLCRRLYSRYVAKPAAHTAERVKEVEEGKFDAEISRLMAMEQSELAELYNNRDMEPRD